MTWGFVVVVEVILPCVPQQPNVLLAVVYGIVLHVVRQVANEDASKDRYGSCL